jgi:hypothetical protein
MDAHLQMLVLVVKKATVLEEFTSEEQRSLVRICGQKDSLQTIFIKTFFFFMVESVCHTKWFTALL